MGDQAKQQTREAPRQLCAAEKSPLYLRVPDQDEPLLLSEPCYTIGAGDNNSVVLADPFVSQRHCRLLRSRGRLWIRDEGSRNGTWVNNVRVERCQLGPGARILLGKSLLRVAGDSAGWRHGIVGRHPRIERVLLQIERVAVSSQPVLVLGETGTGKELVARAIHESSPWRLGPFEPINCGAIPRELAEAEIFGHAQGAYTGASRARQGAFERAHEGTLFLDEIGEMPLELQPKLLRVLEEGVVQRIGEGSRRQVKVRIIAATHRDLPGEAARRRFRLDLYHRLAVGVIELPALRERAEDIPLLVEYFMRQNGDTLAAGIEGSAVRFLQRQPWRGNVRELRNALHRATMESGARLTVEDLSFLLAGQGVIPEESVKAVRVSGRSFDVIRKEVYQLALIEHHGKRAAAAATLGIPKSTFYDQLKEYGIS